MIFVKIAATTEEEVAGWTERGPETHRLTRALP